MTNLREQVAAIRAEVRAIHERTGLPLPGEALAARASPPRDILDRLRLLGVGGYGPGGWAVATEAADEIERLRRLLAERAAP